MPADKPKKKTKGLRARVPENELGPLQTAVRLPQTTVDRIDGVAKKMSQPGLTVSRSEALRVALLRGLDVLEGEHA